ncbi:MAG: outer membrane beta-barrel protein [Candidatus Coatesbacteria bacterium]|nr:outer membrane beta-barrel protein [Candidatus Coatesbacteria bacterium]
MRFKSNILAAFSLASFLLGLPILAKGAFTLRTSLEVTGEYERNPLLLSDEEKEEADYTVNEGYVARYSPEIELDYTAGIGDFRLLYTPSYRTYYVSGRKHTSYRTHVGAFGGELYITDNLSLFLEDSLSDSDVGTQSWSDNPYLDSRRFENSASEKLEFRPGRRLVFMLGHRTSVKWHRKEEEEYRNREENFALGSVGANLGHSTQVGIIGDWGLIDYETSDSSDDRFEYSARGYVNRDLRGLDTVVRAEAGFVTTELKHRNDLEDDSRDCKRSSFTGSLSISRDLGRNTRALLAADSGYWSSEEYAGEYYLTTTVRTSIRHIFLDRVETFLDGRVQRRRYERGNDRRDYVYRLSATAGYRFLKWLSLRAGYTFAKVDSTIQTYEYDNELVHASVCFEYELSR